VATNSYELLRVVAISIARPPGRRRGRTPRGVADLSAIARASFHRGASVREGRGMSSSQHMSELPAIPRWCDASPRFQHAEPTLWRVRASFMAYARRIGRSPRRDDRTGTTQEVSAARGSKYSRLDGSSRSTPLGWSSPIKRFETAFLEREQRCGRTRSRTTMPDLHEAVGSDAEVSRRGPGRGGHLVLSFVVSSVVGGSRGKITPQCQR